MSFATCPKCRDEVRVPSGASDKARVQCPLCLEQFQLIEVLENLPPALVVVNDPGGNGAAHGGGSGFSFGDDDSFADRGGFGDRGGVALAAETKTEAPAFQFESAAPEGDDAVSPAPSSARPAPRRRAKQKNVVVEMVKVVLGGVVGLGGALVAMWYLPFGKDCDPFGVGPTVASIAPFIVPEKYRGVVVDDETPPSTSDDGDSSGSFSFDNWSIKQGNQKDNGQVIDTSGIPFGKNKKNGKKKTNTSNNVIPSNNETTLGSNGFSSNPLDDPPMANNGGNEQVEEGPIEIRHPGMAGVSDLESALSAYRLNAQTWIKQTDRTSDEGVAVSRRFYAALARIGEVLMWGEPDDPEIQGRVGTVDSYLKSLHAADAGFGSVAFIADEANTWLSNTERDNQGVILAGTVLEVKPRGDIFESQVRLDNKSKQKVTVLSFQKPIAQYKRKAKVFLLGVVIDKPAENLSGFHGNDAQVVCSAHVLPIGVDDTIADEPPPSKPSVEPTPMPPVTVPVPTIDVPSFDIKVPTIELKTPNLPSTDSPASEPAPASKTNELPAESTEAPAAATP